jgi:hypothetical protein
MKFILFPQPAPGLVKGAGFGKYIKGLVLLGIGQVIRKII